MSSPVEHGGAGPVPAPSPPTLLIRRAEVAGRLVDVLSAAGRIAAMAPAGAGPVGAAGPLGGHLPDLEIDAAGGSLLPGLRDHHVHLLSLAAHARSVDLGDPELAGLTLTDALRRAERDPARRPGEWLRVVGYHESMGPADRTVLDGAVEGRPVRLQHRSGAMWVLNSRAAWAVGLEEAGGGSLEAPGGGSLEAAGGGSREAAGGGSLEAAGGGSLEAAGGGGIERDAAGRPTGRLFGLDGWLADRVGDPAPDLFAAAARLHRYGVTGVTDLTPVEDAGSLELLRQAARDGLALRMTVATGPALAGLPGGAGDWSPLTVGPVKVYLADHHLPVYPEVRSAFVAARRHGRPVAVHCVTLAALALALAAWQDVGVGSGDRLEHGAVLPDTAVIDLARLGITVVTQPNFIAERGDDYRRDVARDELPLLYRCGSLLRAGVPVAIGTDAPFGHPDPWRAVAAAADRRTADGATIGADERIPAATALGMLLTTPDLPAGPRRRLAVGAVADLCLLDRPLESALSDPTSDHVRATVVGGAVVLDRTRP